MLATPAAAIESTSTQPKHEGALDHLPCDVLGQILRTVLTTQGPLLLHRLTAGYPSLGQIAQTDPLVYPRLLFLDLTPTQADDDSSSDSSSLAWARLALNLSAVFQQTKCHLPSVYLSAHPRTPSPSIIEAIEPLLTVAGCNVTLDLTLWVEDIRPLTQLLYDLDSALSNFRLSRNLLKLVHRGAQSPKLAFPWRPHGSWARVGNSTWPMSAVLASLVRPCAGCGEHQVLFSHPHQSNLACSQVNCAADEVRSDLCNRCRPRTQCWECGHAVQCDKCWLNAGWTKYSPLRSVCTSLTHRTGPVSIPWVCQKCAAAARQEKQDTGRGWVCVFCEHEEGESGSSVH